VQVSTQRHLLVDGANILHAWPELRLLLKKDRDAARAQLVQRLATIHDQEAIRVTIVFDGRRSERVIERPSGESTFSVIHTPAGQTADDVIEQIVANSTEPASCIVATDDRAEIETVAAAGAAVVRVDDLAAWVAQTEVRQAKNLAALRAANQQEWREPS
jgi:predicted RNA-binding protein with PIN domain